MDFQAIRKEYESAGLDEGQLLENPIEQFRVWIDAATENSPGPWFESNAMTLSTSDLNGKCSSRIVLLKGIREDGFAFYTNYLSDKGKELAENPFASLVFNWPYLGRQVRVVGDVKRTSREDSVTYFHSRPRGSQIGAAISAQSEVVESREVLEANVAKMTQELGDQEVPCPEHWGGYLVMPKRIEFWQGRSDRVHDRIVYQLESGNWFRQRLSP